MANGRQALRDFIRHGILNIGALQIDATGKIDMGILEVTTDGGITGGNMNLNGIVQVNGSIQTAGGYMTVIDSAGNIECVNLFVNGAEVKMPQLPGLGTGGPVQISELDGSLSAE